MGRITLQHCKVCQDKMHNPKSFEHIETSYLDFSENGYYVIFMKYRGTNLFNAVVTNTATIKVDLTGEVLGVYTLELE